MNVEKIVNNNNIICLSKKLENGTELKKYYFHYLTYVREESSDVSVLMPSIEICSDIGRLLTEGYTLKYAEYKALKREFILYECLQIRR